MLFNSPEILVFLPIVFGFYWFVIQFSQSANPPSARYFYCLRGAVGLGLPHTYILKPITNNSEIRETMETARHNQSSEIISLVVTTFNRPAKLKRMLSSALNQTRHPYEIIVVNDGSTDDYNEVKSWASTLPTLIWIDQENGGVSTARNKGIQQVTTLYTCFCDDDDYWLPNHIASLEHGIAKVKNPAIVHTYRFDEYLKGELRPALMTPKPAQMTWQEHYVTSGEMVICSTCMPTVALREFPFPESEKFAEDHEQRLRTMSKYDVHPVFQRTSVVDRTAETATNKSVFLISNEYRRRFQAIFVVPEIRNSIRRQYRHQALFRWTSLELSELRQNRRDAFPTHWLRVFPRVRSISNLKTWLLHCWWYFKQD